MFGKGYVCNIHGFTLKEVLSISQLMKSAESSNMTNCLQPMGGRGEERM